MMKKQMDAKSFPATCTLNSNESSTKLSPNVMSMPPTSNFKTRASNCILLTISVICVCVLVVCGVMIVREFALAKNYEQSSCIVTSTKIHSEMGCMFCGGNTKQRKKQKEKGAGSCIASSFPCLHIEVQFTASTNTYVGLMHPDSLQANGPFSQCSYDICLKLPEDNKAAVEKYEESWTSRGNNSFICYYNSKDFKDVIISKRHNKYQVIHSMLWPSVVIFICGAIFLRLEMRRRGITICGIPSIGADMEAGAAQSKALIQVDSIHNHRVQSKLVQAKESNIPLISSSMSSLDKLNKFNGKGGTNGQCITASLSEEGLRHHDIHGTSHLDMDLVLTKLNQSKHRPPLRREPGSITDSDAGSQCSRMIGQETPV